MSTLTQRTVRNIGLVALLQIAAAVVNTITLVVLARLLSPRDFGIVGVAGIALNLVGQLTDFGLGPAVVQRREDPQHAAQVAATVRLTLAAFLVAVVFLLAPLLATLLGEPAATDVIRISSLLWVFAGVGFVSSTLLWRELEFRKLTVVGIVGTLGGAVASIGLAYQNYSYWSIVYGNLIAAGVTAALLWVLRPWALRLTVDWATVRELFRYGKHIFGIGVLTFVVQNVDNAAIATMVGVSALGTYYIAYKWATVVTGFTMRTVGRVLFPTYASIQSREDRVRRGLLNSIRALALVAIPAQVGILLVAPEFVDVVLGSAWSPSVLPLQVISIMGLLTVLAQPIGDFFLATGHPGYLSRAILANAAVLLGFSFPVAVAFGTVGVALLVVGSYAVYAALVIWRLNRGYGIPPRELFRAWRNPFLGAALMAMPVLFAKLTIPSGAVLLAVEVVVGGAVYATVILRLDGKYIRGLLRQAILSSRPV